MGFKVVSVHLQPNPRTQEIQIWRDAAADGDDSDGAAEEKVHSFRSTPLLLLAAHSMLHFMMLSSYSELINKNETKKKRGRGINNIYFFNK